MLSENPLRAADSAPVRYLELRRPRQNTRVSMAWVLASVPGVLFAQSADFAVEEVVVSDRVDRRSLLELQSKAGSHLGLTLRETPATIEILTGEELQQRGARSSVEALNAAPGITAANVASNPGVSSMRGFTSGAISVLYDGFRQSNLGMATRNLDSWSFERLEVLKGPASVLYGEGALAGVVNLVPKHPRLEKSFFSGLASYSSFDSLRLASDVNIPLSARSAMRWVSSYGHGDQFIDDNTFESFATTLGWTWKPNDAVSIDLAADYQYDDFNTAYWGTPLVPANVARRPDDGVTAANGWVLDRSLSEANFNVTNAVTDSGTGWLRSRASWKVDEHWTLTNELSYADAHRRWRNSENYTFNTGTGLLDRGITRIDHDHQFWSERLLATADSQLAGRRNRLSIGGEYAQNQFFNPRRFGTTASIDPFGASRGSFSVPDEAATFPGAGNRTDFDSKLWNQAVFIEDALNVTPSWLVLGGVRYEDIRLDRTIDDFNAGTRVAFSKDYSPISWRAGTVYSLAPQTQLFAQYNSAVAPVGTLLLLSQANSRFSLTTGRSVEGGVRSAVWKERVDVTLAAFRIVQDDIVTRDPTNSNITMQGGQQSSRGVELSLSTALTPSLRIDSSVAAMDVKFDELIEAGGVDQSGHTPPNVSETVANLFAVYRFKEWPLTLSTGARYASHFFTNNANTIRVNGHTVVDASIALRIFHGELTLRGRNLFDELYGEWTGSSATQVLIGAPRSVDLTFITRLP